MDEQALHEMVVHVKRRGIYFAARAIMLVLFAIILFFPQELTITLETPIVLGIMVFGTALLAMILFVDLLLAKQKTVGSLIYKYVFLTMAVILAYGLFYYINTTIIQPPGFEYFTVQGKYLERDVFYFSGVTYFTIGYGDITPMGANAQMASITEAFVGGIINLIVLATAIQRLSWKA